MTFGVVFGVRSVHDVIGDIRHDRPVWQIGLNAGWALFEAGVFIAGLRAWKYDDVSK